MLKLHSYKKEEEEEEKVKITLKWEIRISSHLIIDVAVIW